VCVICVGFALAPGLLALIEGRKADEECGAKVGFHFGRFEEGVWRGLEAVVLCEGQDADGFEWIRANKEG
jgi:hypothetical protein